MAEECNKTDFRNAGRWQPCANVYERYLRKPSAMDFIYWDKVFIMEGQHRTLTGWFMGVRVVQGVAKALVELSPNPNQDANITMFDFKEIKKLVPPTVGESAKGMSWLFIEITIRPLLMMWRKWPSR
jgi:hypothetical protein